MEWSEFTTNNIRFFNSKKFINDDNILLKNIQSEKDNINKFIKNNKIAIDIKLINNNLNNEIQKYGKSLWVSTSLFDNLDDLDKTYEITWELNKILVRTSNTNFLLRIKTLILIIEYLKVKNKINKNVIIYLVLSSLKKKFPTKDEIISQHNINSGYTDISKNIIFIWRLEEFEKVILHEIMHHFNMDMRDHDCDIYMDINGPHSYYEAYTDFQAIFYNIIYISLLTNKPVKELLELELLFIKNQAVQLYNLFGLHETDHIVQKSPAYSYYILKYLIFKHFFNNDLYKINDYNKLLKICVRKLKSRKYIDLGSARMTLLQLH
jgi:hypothetical protein